VVIWYIFSHFGILYKEKPGNPGLGPATLTSWFTGSMRNSSCSITSWKLCCVNLKHGKRFQRLCGVQLFAKAGSIFFQSVTIFIQFQIIFFRHFFPAYMGKTKEIPTQTWQQKHKLQQFLTCICVIRLRASILCPGSVLWWSSSPPTEQKLVGSDTARVCNLVCNVTVCIWLK
jgi:hypothetical protein